MIISLYIIGMIISLYIKIERYQLRGGGGGVDSRQHDIYIYIYIYIRWFGCSVGINR